MAEIIDVKNKFKKADSTPDEIADAAKNRPNFAESLKMQSTRKSKRWIK